MTNDEIFPFYSALWKRVPKKRRPPDDLRVRYYGATGRGEDGYFTAYGQGLYRRPEIGILRPYYVPPEDEPSMTRGDAAPVDLEEEFLILAHEFGHFLSWSDETARTMWGAYYRAAVHRDQIMDAAIASRCTNVLTWRDRVAAKMSGREKRLIVAEETAAWRLGRQFIPESLLDEYDRRAEHGVHCHRYRMGMDPLRPEDLTRGPTSTA